MAEERKPTGEKTELSEELRTLGKRLREAFDAARESPQAQEFQQELRRGADELREELGELRQSEDVQRLQENARAAVQDVTKGDVGQQVRKSVLAALREVNTRLESFIQETEEATEEDTPSQGPSA